MDLVTMQLIEIRPRQAVNLAYLAKNYMLPIQPWGEDHRDEELGAVSVLSRVGHGQEPHLERNRVRVYTYDLQSKPLFFTKSFFGAIPCHAFWQSSRH